MHPSWWSQKGSKIRVESYDPQRKLLILSASVARLEIEPEEGSGESGYYKVRWKVIIGAQREWSEGQRIFTRNDLILAFRLVPEEASDFDTEDRKMLRKYGADEVKTGYYIREGACLNIPEPNNGFFPYSQISIEITDEIQEAIIRLLVRETALA